MKIDFMNGRTVLLILIVALVLVGLRRKQKERMDERRTQAEAILEEQRGPSEEQLMEARQVRFARLQAIRDLERLEKAVNAYRANHGRLPTELATLIEADPDNGGQPYLDRIPDDPWGGSYLFDVSTEPFEILYLGADGARGGSGRDADLSSLQVKVYPPTDGS